MAEKKYVDEESGKTAGPSLEEMSGPAEAETPSCNCRHKHREVSEERGLLNRLSRIEGQIRGIRGMVEEERYCVDIITQVAAVQAALNSFNKVLLERHIKTCVVEDIVKGNSDQTVEELCKTLQKMMK